MAQVNDQAERRRAEIADAERYALSYIFVAQDKADSDDYGYVLPTIMQMLAADDFQDPCNRAVYAAARSLFEQRVPIDIASLATEAGRMGQINQSVAIKTVTQVTHNGTPTIAGWRRAVEVVQLNAMFRRSVYAMQDALPAMVAGTADKAALGVIIDKLLVIQNRTSAVDWEQQSCRSITSELATDIMSEYAMTDAEALAAKYLFPQAGLNKITGGMSKGEMWTVAAVSGGGKTLYADQLATTLAMAGRNVLYVSSEIPQKDLYRRAIASMSGVDYDRIKKRLGGRKFENVEQAQKVLEALDKLAQDNRFTTRYTKKMDEVEGYLRTALARNAVDVLIVDYIQGVKPLTSQMRLIHDKFDGYAKNAEMLADWARQYNIIVVALSQTSKIREYRGDSSDILTMDSLYGSSEIAMNSDGVITLSRLKDDPYNRTRADVVKCRNGKTGKVMLRFDGVHQRFVDDPDANFLPQSQDKAKPTKKKRKFEELPPKVQAKIKEQRFQKSCDDLFNSDDKRELKGHE